MPPLIPPAKNYVSPLIAVPTRWSLPPREGPKMIVCEVDWASMGGPGNCVAFNLQNNATLEFSQICAVSVDNSQCAADVQFIFPDTVETLTVPSYLPKTIVEVFTNQTQFFLKSPNALPGDVTRFSLHNEVPPPITIPITQEQNAVGSGALFADVVGSHVLITPNFSGTLEGLQVGFQGAVGAGIVVFDLKDGLGNFIAGGRATSSPTITLNAIVFSQTAMNVRFQQGIVFEITQTSVPATSAFYVNIYYRTP